MGLWNRCFQCAERLVCSIKRRKSFFHDLFLRSIRYDYRELEGVTGDDKGLHVLSLKSGVRSQKSEEWSAKCEVRSQRSELRSLKLDAVRSVKSAVKGQKLEVCNLTDILCLNFEVYLKSGVCCVKSEVSLKLKWDKSHFKLRMREVLEFVGELKNRQSMTACSLR